MTAVARLAAVAIAVTLAAGCGDDEADSATTEPATTAATTTEPATTTEAEPAPGAGGDEKAGEVERPQPGLGVTAPSPGIAAEAVLTRAGTAEQACGGFVTARFIRTAYGGEANCIAARRPSALAASITTVPGSDRSSTRIVVVPNGGPYDGAEVEVILVEQDGGFRVDGLRADVPAGP
jgi:hypothetical protein